MSPAPTRWGMTQAKAMTVTVMGQVSGKRMGGGGAERKQGKVEGRIVGEWFVEEDQRDKA